MMKKKKAKAHPPASIVKPLNYAVPEWSAAPPDIFRFEVIKGGVMKNDIVMDGQPYCVFGRDKISSFVIDHPHCSRQHAVVQFNAKGECFIFDLGSRHGTFLNNKRIEMGVFVQIYVGDKIAFGRSERGYFLQGNEEYTRPMPEDNKKSSPEKEKKVEKMVVESTSSENIENKKVEEKKGKEIKKIPKFEKIEEPVFFRDMKKKDGEEPSFLAALKKKHQRAKEANMKSLPFKSNASIETIISFAKDLPDAEKKKCLEFKKKTKQLNKLEEKMHKIASKGEELGKREQLRQKKEKLEIQLSSLEDHIRNAVFKDQIQSEKRFKKKQNESLDARMFDDSDDFFDRAKVIKKRKKISMDLAEEDLDSLQEKKKEIEEAIEKCTDPEEKKSLTQEMVQIKSRIFQKKMKLGMPPKKKAKITNIKTPSSEKLKSIIKFGILGTSETTTPLATSPKEPSEEERKKEAAKLKTDADGFKVPKLPVKRSRSR